MYRWLAGDGRPCSPRHRSLETAVGWLRRQPAQPYTRPWPARLVHELDPTQVTRRARRRPLDSRERERLVELAIAQGFRAEGPRAWLFRQARQVQERRRRRRAVAGHTTMLRARRGA